MLDVLREPSTKDFKNVMEQDKTLELPDDSFVDTFGGDDMETLDALSSAGDSIESE